MTNVFPNSNLPTVSQPWGREVQKRVTNLESQFSLQRTNAATIDAQLQSSYRRIDSTLNGIIGLGASGSGYTINADNINGGTITGTTLQTSATGQRVVISDLDEIKFYDESGTLALTMEGTGAVGDGTFVMYSRSLTNTTIGSPGSSIYISDESLSINSYKLDQEESSGILLAGDEGLGIFGATSIVRLQIPDTTTKIELTSSGIILTGTSISLNGNLGGIDVSSLYSSGQINADGNVFGATLTAKDNGGIFGGSLSVTNGVSGSSASFSSISGGAGTFNSSLQSSNIPGNALGSGAVDVYASSTLGRLGVQSSSKNTKQDIKTVDLDINSILSIEPKTFKYNVDVVEFGLEQTPTVVGFIAEDLDEAGLGYFVHYGKDGLPESIPYSKYVVALQAVVRNLNDRITELEKGA